MYRTKFTVFGKLLNFSWHLTEEDAVKEVDFLKTLAEEELLSYKQVCLAKSKRPKRTAKNYSWYRAKNKYIVQFIISGKNKYFGCYLTEQEAINRVKQVKQDLGIN